MDYNGDFTVPYTAVVFIVSEGGRVTSIGNALCT